MTRELRAVCRYSSWLHRFARSSLSFAAIASVVGVVGVAQAVAGSASLMSSAALISLALVAAAAGGAGRAAAVIEGWLDVLGRAFDGACEAQLLAGSDSRAVQANLAFERLFPSAGEAALDLVEQAAEPASLAAFRALCEQAATGAHAIATIRLQPANSGPPRLFEISVEPATERPGYRLWTFRDVGARHRQPPPDGAGAFFAELLDRASTGFYSLDSEDRFVAVNYTLAKWLGVSATELIDGGARLHDFLAVSSPAQASRRDRLDIDVEPGEVSLRTRQGDIIDVRIAQSPTGSGAELRVNGVVHLLAPQHLSDSAAGQSRKQLQRFFANAPVGIAVVDRSGRFIEANRALGDVFETSPETLIGRGLIGCLHPDDREAIAAKLTDAADGREDRTPVEIRLNPAGERTMVMLLSRFDQPEHASATLGGGAASGAPASAVVPGSGPAGDPVEGLTLYFIDVTEQKHLETEAVEKRVIRRR